MAKYEAASLLAGFLLAHAAWNVSDLPKGDLLVPMAIVEVGSERKLERFVAETQEIATSRGKQFVAEQQVDASAWAFARERQIKASNRYVDVLVVDAWGKGMAEPISYLQTYQPFESGVFKLLAQAIPVVAGKMLSPENSKPCLTLLYRGFSSPGKAAALWPSWQ